MMHYVIAYIGAIVTFLILDAIWLGFIAIGFFKKAIGHLMGPMNVPAAAIFYLIYCVGVIFFAVSPALQSNSWQTATLYGALFGFFCFATYDMTNYATLRDWPLRMVVVDMTWGVFVTAAMATGGYFAAKAFG